MTKNKKKFFWKFFDFVSESESVSLFTKDPPLILE
nr:MAG TPA: hypothetical protein [Caudoviricetes sp.]